MARTHICTDICSSGVAHASTLTHHRGRDRIRSDQSTAPAPPVPGRRVFVRTPLPRRSRRARLGAGDVLIVPELGDLSSADFTAGLDRGIPLGAAATEAAAKGSAHSPMVTVTAHRATTGR